MSTCRLRGTHEKSSNGKLFALSDLGCLCLRPPHRPTLATSDQHRFPPGGPVQPGLHRVPCHH